MSKTNLMGYTLGQLEETMATMGEESYRGRQLFKWLYHNREHDFDLLTDLSKELRSRLARTYEIRGLEIRERVKSVDGTEKFLFRLEDDEFIETVLIPDNDRRTVCISSQVGCALNCQFCATGTLGFKRNLTVGEIVGQLVMLRELYGEDCFTNVVFMGMGEPLLNLDNIVAAVRIISDSSGLGHGAKKIAISTAGLPSQIRKLADSLLKTRLAVSLNAPTQEKRAVIMPIASKFKLDDLMDAIRYYTDKTGFRVIFEYILFEGFNDSMDDVLALSRLIDGVPCKINILAYNPVATFDYRRPSDEKVDWFGRQLYPRAPAVTIRKSRGRDISAACGQLAGSVQSTGD
jgi:23S rRNA (adenine2503-C2)-methyltransferase